MNFPFLLFFLKEKKTSEIPLSAVLLVPGHVAFAHQTLDVAIGHWTTDKTLSHSHQDLPLA